MAAGLWQGLGTVLGRKLMDRFNRRYQIVEKGTVAFCLFVCLFVCYLFV